MMYLRVSLDADGRPLCPHCGDPLVEAVDAGPGLLQCPEAASLRPAFAELVKRLEAHLEGQING